MLGRDAEGFGVPSWENGGDEDFSCFVKDVFVPSEQLFGAGKRVGFDDTKNAGIGMHLF